MNHDRPPYDLDPDPLTVLPCCDDCDAPMDAALSIRAFAYGLAAGAAVTLIIVLVALSRWLP